MSAITHQELVQNYQVIRVLGEGSFGKVFLIRHLQSKMQFAMKKYSKYHILKNGKQRALIRSSQILQALDHVNIIKFLYYAIGDQDDQIFLIFEACKKGSLEQLKQKIFNIKQIIIMKQVMYQLAEGLRYLKSICVAHRDLKPSNISFNSQGQLKIIDFDQAVCFKQMAQISLYDESFAKQLIQQTSTMNTYCRRSRVNSYVGTQLYMSPEMKNRAVTDERADLWAYGCILFQLVSGRPFTPQYQDVGIQQTLQNYYNDLIRFQILEQQKQQIFDLLNKILKESPDQRMSVDEVIGHPFFQQLRTINKKNQSRIRFKKFLRGNYNQNSRENVYDSLNMDLIGMKFGEQKPRLLYQHPALIYFQKQMIDKPSYGIFKRIKQYLKSILRFPEYKVCYLLGGREYFKQRSTVNQNEKSYIKYDQIDSIQIIEDSIIIQGSNIDKWSKQEPKFKWRYTIKSLIQDQLQLGNLYDILHYIWVD